MIRKEVANLMYYSPILLFRWLNLALSSTYFIYLFFITDHSMLGWQFRYLTIWALTANCFSSALMLNAFPKVFTDSKNEIITSIIILNAAVVFLYWRLHFIDPKLINGDNARIWYLDYYLHLVGPVMQWIDGALIYGAFKKPLKSFKYIIILFASYTLWIELIVQPYNSIPEGTVTSGLPYPFLNNLNLIDRLEFYSKNMFFVVCVFFVGITATWVKKQTLNNK